MSISSNSIKRDFIDINGDGYPDIVELKNDTVNIYLNKGYEIEEECSNLNSSITKISEYTSIYINTYLGITAGFTFCGTYKFNAGVHSTYSGSIESGTSSEFMDINGDGLPDYVISDNKNNRLLVYLNKTNKTNLLNKIINPTQEIIELDYTLSDVNQNKKERNWQLTQITEYQPSNYKNSQEKSFIEIEYSDPYYDNFERTYYGYSNVITEYNKEKFIIEKFENKNYLNAGEKTEDWLLDRQYKPIIRHKIGKEYKHATTGTIITNLCDDANIQEAQSGYWTYYYEGEDAPQIITYYSIEYDSIHNMIRYEDKGDTAVVGDEYVQIITYLPTTSKNQISLPKTEIIKDHTGKILRSSSINYDTNGSPKQIVFHNQTNNTDAITSFEYDNYGNIILLAKPENINGERAFTSYDYDPVCAMYPQKISDEFELNTEIYYDYRFGLPIKKIDVAGNTLLYKYDYIGRLTNVLMPNEITDNYPYTIKYDYYNVNHELKLQEDFLLENNIYQQQPGLKPSTMFALTSMPCIFGRHRWACACPVNRASDARIIKRNFFIGSAHLKFVDGIGTHQILVLNHEGLVTTTVLLIQFHHEALVVRDGELRHREHRALALFARHAGSIILRTEWQDNLLLHGGTLRHLLVHNLPCHVVHIKRHVALVLDFRVEIQQSVVRIDSFQQVLYAETLAADVLHLTLVLLVDGLHDKSHQHRTLAAQFLQVNLLRIVRTVYRLAVVDEVAHLHVEQQRLLGILHVEGIEAAVLRDDAHVRLVLEVLHGRLHTDHVLRTVRLARYQVGRAQIHIAHLCRKDDVYGLVVCHL